MNGKVFKLKCTSGLGKWHTVGATYEFRFDDKYDVDGYVFTDQETKHWINFPGSTLDQQDEQFKTSDYFQCIGVEDDHATE